MAFTHDDKNRQSQKGAANSPHFKQEGIRSAMPPKQLFSELEEPSKEEILQKKEKSHADADNGGDIPPYDPSNNKGENNILNILQHRHNEATKDQEPKQYGRFEPKNLSPRQFKQVEPFQLSQSPAYQRSLGQEKSAQKKSSTNRLPEEIQAKMEDSTGHDFSNVNIHKESANATDMGALAYAQGNDIHFAPGQFNPDSQKGQELIGHELTHVVQQREGRVVPTKKLDKGIPVNDSPTLETEADEMGRKVAGLQLKQPNESGEEKEGNIVSTGTTIQMYGEINPESGAFEFTSSQVTSEELMQAIGSFLRTNISPADSPDTVGAKFNVLANAIERLLPSLPGSGNQFGIHYFRISNLERGHFLGEIHFYFSGNPWEIMISNPDSAPTIYTETPTSTDTADNEVSNVAWSIYTENTTETGSSNNENSARRQRNMERLEPPADLPPHQHFVQPGDTLWGIARGIARREGIPVSAALDELARLNPQTNERPQRLQVNAGEILNIAPPPESDSIESPEPGIRSREALETIAQELFEAFNEDEYGFDTTNEERIFTALEGLLPDEVQTVREIYAERFSSLRGGRSLTEDLVHEMRPYEPGGDGGEFMRAADLLVPGNFSRAETSLRLQHSGEEEYAVQGAAVSYSMVETQPPPPSLPAQTSVYPRIREAVIRAPSGAVVTSLLVGDDAEFSFDVAEIGTYEVIAIIEHGHRSDFEIIRDTLQVRTAASLAEESLPEQGQEYLSFRARLGLMALSMGQLGTTSQNAGDHYLDSGSTPNPLPSQVGRMSSYTFRSNDADFTGTGRYRWYVKLDEWNRIPTRNYHGLEVGLVDGERALISSGNSATVSLPLYFSNIYTIVCEEINDRGAPTGVSAMYRQVVLSNEDFQQREELREYTSEVEEEIAGITDEINLPTVYVNQETGNRVPLNLYLGRDREEDGEYLLLDLSPVARQKSYSGGNIRELTTAFKNGNTYPVGLIMIEIPEGNPFGFQSQRIEIETTGSSLWQTLSSRAGWISLVAAAVGIGANFFLPGSGLAVNAMYLSIAAGAASSVANIADQVQSGQIDTLGVIIDSLSIVSSIVAAGTLRATRTLRGGLGSASSLSINNRGRFLLMAGASLDASSGLLVSVQGAGQINRILQDSSMSREEKVEAILGIMANLALTGGLIYLSITDANLNRPQASSIEGRGPITAPRTRGERQAQRLGYPQAPEGYSWYPSRQTGGGGEPHIQRRSGSDAPRRRYNSETGRFEERTLLESEREVIDQVGSLELNPGQQNNLNLLEQRRMEVRAALDENPGSSLLQQQQRTASYQLGEFSAELYMQERLRGARRIYPPEGIPVGGTSRPGEFDQVWVQGDQMFLVEAKGGVGNSPGYGSRSIQGMVRAQQGSPAYMDSIISALSEAHPRLAQGIHRSYSSGNLNYLSIHQRLHPNGSLRDLVVSQFSIGREGIVRTQRIILGIGARNALGHDRRSRQTP